METSRVRTGAVCQRQENKHHFKYRGESGYDEVREVLEETMIWSLVVGVTAISVGRWEQRRNEAVGKMSGRQGGENFS